MKNLEIYDKFRNVPNEAKKEIGAGRLKGFTDINPMWRIKMLTEQFGMCGVGWYTEITKEEIIEGSDKQKCAFTNINLYVKIENEWSKPIPGVGGSSFIANERNGLYTSDECFKMAYTDALSIACKSLGMGADVYFAKDRTKYDQLQPEQKQPEQKQTAPVSQLTPEQQAAIDSWNKNKTGIEIALKNVTTKEEYEIIKSSYPELLTYTPFVKLLQAKFATLNA